MEEKMKNLIELLQKIYNFYVKDKGKYDWLINLSMILFLPLALFLVIAIALVAFLITIKELIQISTNTILHILTKNTYKYIIDKKAIISDVFANAPPAVFWSFLPAIPALSISHLIFIPAAFIVNTPQTETETEQNKIKKLKADIKPFYFDLCSEIEIKGKPIRHFIVENTIIADFILTKIAIKASRKPWLYPIYPPNFDLDILEKNIKLDIKRQYKNLLKALKSYVLAVKNNKKPRAKADILPAIFELYDLKKCQQKSINSTVYADNQKVELGDLISIEKVDSDFLEYKHEKEQVLFDDLEKKIIIRKPYQKQKTKLFTKICKNVNKNSKLEPQEKFKKATELYDKATSSQEPEFDFDGEVYNG